METNNEELVKKMLKNIPESKVPNLIGESNNKMVKLPPYYGKIIILEGPNLTYKTTLGRKMDSRYGVTYISAEWQVEHKPFQPYIGPNLMNITPSYTGIIMEAFYHLVRILQIFRYQTFVIDRFHISAQFFQRKFRNMYTDFIWLEEMLLPLDARIILCTRDPKTYEAALQKRLSQSYHPELYPTSNEEFAKDQEIYRRLVQQSYLKSLKVDVTNGNLERVIREIVQWLGK